MTRLSYNRTSHVEWRLYASDSFFIFSLKKKIIIEDIGKASCSQNSLNDGFGLFLEVLDHFLNILIDLSNTIVKIV